MGLLQVVWPLAVSMLRVYLGKWTGCSLCVLCDLEALLLLPFPEMKSKTEKLFSFLLSLRFLIFKTVEIVPTSQASFCGSHGSANKHSAQHRVVHCSISNVSDSGGIQRFFYQFKL